MKVGSFEQLGLPLSLSLSFYFSLLPFLLFSHYCLAFSALRSLASLGPSFAQVSHRFRVDSLWTGSLLAPLVLFPSIPAIPFPNDVSNPEVPQAYHLRYRRLVKGFPLSALHHVALPSTTPSPSPSLTFLPAPPLSTLLLRLTAFRPQSLFVIRTFSNIRHLCSFVLSSLFFHSTPKSQFC